MTVIEAFHDNRDAAIDAVARRIESLLGDTLAERGAAALAVSGGGTPGPVYRRLADAALDWSRVTVTLTDERWVPAGDPDSNEGMLCDTLFAGEAAAATLMPLYRAHSDPDEACADLAEEFERLPLPLAATLLGMGADGHFASLFPDYQGLAAALAADGRDSYVAVSTSASPHPRISMTLSALTRSREILLLIFGADKRQVYERAKAGDGELPIAALLAQTSVPLTVVWAP